MEKDKNQKSKRKNRSRMLSCLVN